MRVDQTMQLLALSLALLLVGAGIWRRRLGRKRLVSLALLWSAIIGALWLTADLLIKGRLELT